jgi:DNA integrity scanning protein DisA with diadenylate cyclase activity
MTCCATTFCQNDSTRYVDSSDEKGGVNVLAVVDPRLVLDVLFASSIGFLLFSRVNEQRTLWLLRGWLFLVAMAWFVQRFANLPLTTKLVDALVMACSLSLAILWQGELRRLMELLGTGRLAVLLGNPQKEFSASAGRSPRQQAGCRSCGVEP